MTQARLCTERDLQRWDEYVAASHHANCYHQAGWKAVVERSFGITTHYLLAEDESQTIVGVLPLALLSSVAFGRFMVSLPYFTYGGVCASDPAVRDQLLRESIRVARSQGVDHLELRHTEADADGLSAKTSKISMRLPLPSTAETLWASFPSKLRNKIRRAQKEDMVVRFCGMEGLDDFYRVFAINMRELGTPVYSKSFFANILKEFPGSTRICTLYHGDTAAASGFLVGFKDTLEIPWGASLRSRSHLSPNRLLYWSMLKFACEAGYRTFDFGRCTPGGATHQFKEEWGAQAVPLYWHYWMKRDGPLPELNPHNPKYSLAIRMWKRLPLRITTLVGPTIVKHLP